MVAERHKDDFYITPEWCVHRLLERLPFPKGDPLFCLDPAFGSGAIVKAIESYQKRALQKLPETLSPIKLIWEVCDLNPMDPLDTKDLDINSALNIDFRETTRHDFVNEINWIVTNPPFYCAEDFILKSQQLFPTARLTLLLKLNFMASAGRIPLWAKVGEPDVYVLPNRPSFTPDGDTDMCEYGWFDWDLGNPKNWGFITHLNLTDKSVRKEKNVK